MHDKIKKDEFIWRIIMSSFAGQPHRRFMLQGLEVVADLLPLVAGAAVSLALVHSSSTFAQAAEHQSTTGHESKIHDDSEDSEDIPEAIDEAVRDHQNMGLLDLTPEIDTANCEVDADQVVPY